MWGVYYDRSKKRVTFAGRREVFYIFYERSYEKEMHVWRIDNVSFERRSMGKQIEIFAHHYHRR